ncbi:MAG: hypothetical protein HOV87_12240 [Catenulispora sp.]|nr:hypothetical protein [Catenulispora sp.]NUT39983.1 hypothetical protein [Thermoactinospora sp.]
MESIPYEVLTNQRSADLLLELTAIDSPTERARRIGQIARSRGNLPRPLFELRRLALIEARRAGMAVKNLAAELGLSPARVSQLTASAFKKAVA